MSQPLEQHGGVAEAFRSRGFRGFFFLWLSEFLSSFASEITRFAYGVLIWKQTGSVTSFALAILLSALPPLVFGPLIAPLIDRNSKRLALLVGFAGLFAATGVLIAFNHFGEVTTPHLYVYVIVSSLLLEIVVPALLVSMRFLVAPRHLSVATGMTQSGMAVSKIAAPLAGAALLTFCDFGTILIMDLVTFAIPIIYVIFAPIDWQVMTPETGGGVPLRGHSSVFASAFASIKEGYTWIKNDHACTTLTALLFINNVFSGAFVAVFTPFLLTVGSLEILSKTNALAGVGALIGSVIVTIWGGRRRESSLVLIAVGLTGLAGCAIGILKAYVFPLMLFATLRAVLAPVINSSSHVFWMKRTPIHMQSRIWAARRMIVWGAFPIAQSVVGPLTERGFAPFFDPIFGVGGGLAVVIFCSGLLQILGTLALGDRLKKAL